MLTPDYFYTIVGGGLAGLQLAYSFSNDIFFRGKKIAIIEPSLKDVNDKTWCFWEKEPGKWDLLKHHSWNSAKMFAQGDELDLKLAPYQYKMIRSIDFYNFLKDELAKNEHIYFVKDHIEKIDLVTRTAIGKKKNYTATHFFDSRVEADYKNSNYPFLQQHFRGKFIESKTDVFDPSTFTIMDYRLKYQNTTSFIYVLPVTARKALVEYTFFSPELVDEDVYEENITNYIEKILQIEQYEILEKEAGNIPMTTYPFEEQNSEYLTKIGTAGGWVKASTGYSFKNTERIILKVLENIKSGRIPGDNLINKRFRKFDAIFLDVLQKRNDLGEELFYKFYAQNDISKTFEFLDEHTWMNQNLKIMFSLYHPEFLKAFFRQTFG